MVKNKGRKSPPRRPQQGQRPPQNRRPSQTPQNRRPGVPPSDARRKQMLRKKKLRKRRRIVFYTTFLLLLIVVGVVLSLTVFFKIQTISVVGKVPYEKQRIIDLSGIEKDENMFLLNRKKIEDKISKNLPYIGTTKIKFKLPDTIHIVVEKTSDKQVFKSDNGYVITNENGKVLKIGQKDFDKKLIEIKGANVEKAKAGYPIEYKNSKTQDTLKTLMNALTKYKIKDINCIDISKPMYINFKYQNRIEVLFGSCSNVERKMEFLKKVIDRENQRSTDQKGVIDLQYINSSNGNKEKVYFRPAEATTKPQKQKPKEEKTTQKVDKNKTTATAQTTKPSTTKSSHQ